MTQITHLNIEVTRRCNQRCGYCFNDSRPASDISTLSVAAWASILKVLRGLGLTSTHLTGGEPFVWPGTLDLLAESQAQGFRTSILSSGYRVPEYTKASPALFRELTVAQISLDAMTPVLHDARRGTDGAWRQAISAIEALRSLGVPIEVSTVVSDGNLKELVPLALFCQQSGYRLLLRPLVPFGRAATLPLSPLSVVEEVNKLDARFHDILVGDRFAYVPSEPGFDQASRERGIYTADPLGRIRGTSLRVGEDREFSDLRDIVSAA